MLLYSICGLARGQLVLHRTVLQAMSLNPIPTVIHAIFVGPQHRLCVCRNNTGKVFVVVECLSSDTGGVGTLIPEGHRPIEKSGTVMDLMVYICESEYNI